MGAVFRFSVAKSPELRSIVLMSRRS